MQRFPNSKGIKKRYRKLFRRKLEAIKKAQINFEEKNWREKSRASQGYLWKVVKQTAGIQKTSYPPLGDITDPKEKAQTLLQSYQSVS